jgi:hypothetical protein
MVSAVTTPTPRPVRAGTTRPTLRLDRWWASPAATVTVLTSFVGYTTWAAFAHADYYWAPYISPFYSPCLATTCLHARAGSLTDVHVPTLGLFGPWWVISPAVIILVVPLGFRLTCYYYRKAYYRSFWLSPPSCAVAEPHRRYTGETRFPLVLQNIHRYFFYLGLVLNAVLTYDAVVAFRNHGGQWGHMGFGTLVLVVNAGLLWLYTLGCHSCRHLVAGKLKHFSRHPVRHRLWAGVSYLNARHMQFAWASLIFVALTDLYVRLVSSGTIADPRFF